jgi:hypothetical protein
VTLRLAAALALALGVVGMLGFLHLLGEGPFATPEARHMRSMKDRSVAPAAVSAVSVSLFDSLPYRRPLVEYAPLERRGVVMEGYIKHMLRAPDGDIHLEVAGRLPEPGTTPLYATAEITPQWHRGARHWTYESLRAAFRCGSGGDVTRWREPPRRVRLTGWLMYDFQFETRRPDRTRAPSEQRESGWELHPVTKIEIWDDARAAFVEVPR